MTSGQLAREATALNPGFLSRMERGRPWVRVILAVRADAEQLRARSSAVMTGIATVLADDPGLDLRLPGVARQPLRVVLDSQLRTPAHARIIAAPGPSLILTASGDVARAAALEAAGARVVRVPAGPGGLALSAVMRHLAGLEVNELQVESGPTLAASLARAQLVDELLA